MCIDTPVKLQVIPIVVAILLATIPIAIDCRVTFDMLKKIFLWVDFKFV